MCGHFSIHEEGTIEHVNTKTCHMCKHMVNLLTIV
jgi:hypothetical protein